MKNMLLLLLLFLLTGRSGAQEVGIPELTLCWDVSASMIDRDFAKEKAFLDSYFQEHPDVQVNLLPFSAQVWGLEQYKVQAGQWKELEQRLQALPSDGATNFADLSGHAGTGDILIFTDGRQNLSSETPVFSGRLTVVNSRPDYDAATLNLLTLLNEADLYHLNETPASRGSDWYSGEIVGELADTSEVELTIGAKGAPTVRPDRAGHFSIPAQPGDTLYIWVHGRHAGSQVLGRGRTLSLWLSDSGEIRLDEVVVTDSRPENNDKVATAYGLKDKDAVGYAVQSVSSDRFPDAATEVSSVVQGKFSGVGVGQNDDISRFETRTKWSILSNNYGLIVLDGVPLGKANSSYYASASSGQDLGFLDPRNIASITVLKGLVATNRYGSAGANGVLLITSKAGALGGKASKPKDLALLSDNIYDGKIRPGKTIPDAPYLHELKKARDVGEAYAIYLSLRPQYKDQPVFFIDMAAYMKEAAPSLSFRILSNLLEVPNPDVGTLKALMFQASRYEMADLEFKAAERFLTVFPTRVDAYLHLARARAAIGAYQAAASLLVGILDGSAQEELDFNPIRKTAQRELANLVFLHARELDLSAIPAQYRGNLRYNARIVCEWSRADMDFRLQFVNPQKRFFTWDHGLAADPLRVRQEVELGYATEEFEITGEGVAGEWIINLDYTDRGDTGQKDPVYLNCRVQYNFGRNNQRTENYVVRLSETGSQIQLAKLVIE